MELITAIEAGTLVTTIVSFITDNMPAILVVLGFAVGLRIARGFLNRSKSGKL